MMILDDKCPDCVTHRNDACGECVGLLADESSIVVIDLWPHESECGVCGKALVGGNLGIAMYEGCVVPDDWKGDWAGFDCCSKCFELHDLGLLSTWPDALIVHLSTEKDANA